MPVRIRFEKLVRVIRGPIWKRFFIKEYEPQEAKQSAFKKKKESFMCVFYAYLINEILSIVWIKFQVKYGYILVMHRTYKFLKPILCERSI